MAVLNGTIGSDILVSTAGADYLYGGQGADLFVFDPGSGNTSSVIDVIDDFNIDQGDKVVLQFDESVLPVGSSIYELTIIGSGWYLPTGPGCSRR